MTDPARHQDGWAVLVGRFILAFGDIELISFFLWERYFGDEEPPHNFKERTGKVLFHTKKDRDISPAITELLQEALKIADKRNTIAHNPISVQVYRHSETGRLVHQLAIRSRIGGEYIDDAKLIDLTNRTQQIASWMHNGIWHWNE